MKKRRIAIFLAALMIATMVGCGETTKTSTNSKESTQDSADADTQESTDENTQEEAKENRQTILDNDTVKIEYVKTTKGDYETDMTFHVENKSGQNIIIQPEDSISLDDTMYMAMASQDVMAGKQADFNVTLSTTDGTDLDIPDFSKASGTMNVLDENFETITQQTFDISK